MKKFPLGTHAGNDLTHDEARMLKRAHIEARPKHRPSTEWLLTHAPKTVSDRAKRKFMERVKADSTRYYYGKDIIDAKAGDVKPRWNEHDAELDLLDRQERRAANRRQFSLDDL